MAVDIVIPQAGESVTTGVLTRWLKAEGDYVKRDEDVLELETDKVTLTVPSPAAGTVKIGVAAGETVKIGQVVGGIDDKAAAPAAGAKPAPQPVAAAEVKPSANGKPPVAPANVDDVRTTPLARKLADEHGIELGAIHGTGAGGRIREQDVQAAIEAKASGGTAVAAKSAATSRPTGTAIPAASRREKMSPLRQRIAARLVEAQQNAAMLTTFNECDMSAVMALRSQYKESFEKKHGVGLGFMSFFVKACVNALRQFPAVNASIVQSPKGGLEVEYHESADIAMAVGTPKGLVVPVLRRCDQLGFAQIEQGIKDMAAKARDGKLTLADLQGGTFTITNGGIYGSLMSTPILNPPQTGILGMHAIKNRAVEFPVGSGQVAIRPMMYLALSYDHRLIDGAEAVQFLVAVKNAIEDPSRLLLGM
ncbi:MAG: 2-oxoglutarate dehydrogenase complex dihydrolipoyllysine-residue succinyltransferase [Phycisphaerales bacterium]|nr:2-oxoglutarate dehydrogenase complex dihydrolipoyllysine-residue succinyltransferase [Phycisphaerales bacterium]